MTLSAIFLENLSYSATQVRQIVDQVFNAGVLDQGLAVSQHAGTPARNVDVAVGSCVIAGQGKYLCKSDAIVTVALNAAPSTGNSRISLIVAQVLDADANGGSSNLFQIVEVAGTPATTGSQVAPATPATALVLAQVLVGPNVTVITNSNITDERIAATDALSNDSGWLTPSFINSWSDAGTGRPVAYRLKGDRVMLRGAITGGSTGTTAFTLPTGYRPLAGAVLIATVNNAGAYAYITVNGSGGLVQPNMPGGGTGVWLDGMTFTID